MRFSIPIAILFAAGCRGPIAAPPATVTGPKSPYGWEVRYNAALALARRGSPHVKDPEVWDSLLEMLDADQQLRNFRVKAEDGHDTIDENCAYATVISGLQAAQDLHRKQPQMDLSGLKESVDKLSQSPNPTLAIQAKQARLAVFP
jgi:hypothetical protein